MAVEPEKINSILLSIKHKLGLDEIDYFDSDVIIDINTVLSTLNQLGIGPKHCYSITGPEEKWSDFLGDTKDYEMVKTLVYLKVKLLFDPPTSGILMESINKQISEMEWRLYVRKDNETGGNA